MPVHEPPDNKSSINKITKNIEQIKNINNNEIMINKRAIHELPLQYKRRDMLISKMVGYIKMQSAKQINLLRNTSGNPVWQRNFYDHIIRNDKPLNRIREYIVNNPKTWDNDIENPNRIGNIETELIRV